MSTGFRHAPTSRFLVSVVGGYSVLTKVLEARLDTRLELPLTHHELWRLFSTHWAFGSIGTTVIGTWLIYHMRVIERRYGTAKYTATISIITCTLLQTGALLLIGNSIGLKSIASGPYGVLFAILYQFHNQIPVCTRSERFGSLLNDKTYVYTAAISLFFSNGLASAIPCLCGLLVGAVYDANLGAIKEYRFPRWMSSFASRFVLPILNTSPVAGSSGSRTRPASSPAVSQRRGRETNRDLRQRRPHQQQEQQEQAAVVVPEEDINAMMSMFPEIGRQNVISALVQSHNDLNRAAEIILST
ncbi:hypothetical protein F4703DRAFT_1957964 [Phycomyces blakesleeanus]|uniref:UBA domain-containing protein n=1 Tax=Phycomyces blakesleeanus (strain ATCC 8743b / DSM 1359 / FGSC 10004 / NBRC 33097 / NRRL 1555) TaxID=763407 RepID=A0A162PHS4_PHYB8|nr:hypothetical protein PHYBLDRAFT_65104 [Phycomyces blakesleeanus NRRL 1555(-)]OAD72967.1 hypothetical protein PHYBLDRAFT_65104 [Phycomyces blakesleeanus NRRL 1555(-)]|eukprot:XP_018291007.1 hypothetical protein PHYBLDRAFT_65104 [Phycomyces blakesleeanus NRRL 1555(-)]